ncbi:MULTISPECIES: alpha/beta fold hydrolase [Flavobacteriaceae]|jgi:pimeloyl-ACP methyl ester carboxylesterase|uniref:alpha/beta fold hydrolase n=1 Tax=Flavobacteriaceae TaxID=49546 RepID=UPI0015C7A8F7|nr:alpha/beta hydrolase [Muricauda sp. ARW1Y1]NYJ28881.1 pimeloyl-ACP methyl ester carboxylesterase [Muricauda sp. ARW1Y1]
MKKIYLLFTILLSCATQAQQTDQPIHVQVSGSGAPILLIPGFTVPGDSWEATVNQLEENYECHVLTLAGFGGKSPIEFPWLPKINASIENYIQENQLNDLTIIGHSLGGTIATWLASRENSQIAKLILVDALPAAGAMMIPNFDPENLAYESPYNNQLLSMNDADFEKMAQGMAQGMSLRPEAQEKIKDWILLSDRKTYVYGYTDYLKLDMREDLKNISIPVTIIAADKPYGKEMVTQTYKNQYANLAQYDLIIAENAAHFVMFDQPEWFMEQIQNIIAAH